MSTRCAAPIEEEDLVSYWAGDLDRDETDRIDEHLMGCERCSASSARIAAVAEGVRAMIPPIVSTARVAALRARGQRIVEKRFSPAARTTAVFPANADVLLLRLGGMHLADAERVEITLTHEDTGAVLLEDADVPFDSATGEVFVACQRHFGETSVTIVFEVRARYPSGATEVARFAIPHVFEPREA
jgi:hypothetical protein